jgi:hypothetical protein
MAPNETVDACLFAGNMVGVRWGDNYGSGYNYNATMEVKNSFVLNSHFKDAFSGQWHPTPGERVDLSDQRHQHLRPRLLQRP